MEATKIEQYNAAKREQAACQRWAALIGARYMGGGGGFGKLTSLRLMQGESSPTIYHQERDGATNYHNMPSALAVHLEAAIKAKFGELLADALAMQEVAVKAAAEDAVKEHARLLEAAGLAA